MSSSRTIDFRLRANKGIERAISFEVLTRMKTYLGPDPVFVGLGSLWFVDFRLAHRLLGIETMLSIEADAAIAARAEFNKPYRSIEIVPGVTTDKLPELLERSDLAKRPWIVWLDYDSELTDERIEELRTLVVELPEGSAVLTTFNATPNRYGDFDHRLEALQDLFGLDIVGEEVDQDALTKARFGATLASSTLDFLESAAIRSGRRGPFVPTTSLRYIDSSAMVTVGGIMPRPDDAAMCVDLTESSDWPGRDDIQIASEPLTMREIEAICTLLPTNRRLRKKDVRELGFEITEEQLALFQRHYLRYPSYAEIVS